MSLATGGQLERSAFIIACLFGLFLIWQVPHPPMMDLPQHVAQIALLHDLLFSTHPYADEFRLDYFTPYWLFYGPAALLTSFMPVLIASKLLLSLIFLAFICTGHLCLRQFNSPPHLLWLFLPAFFGLCWMMGFVTFLGAAPLVFLALIWADQYSTLPTARAGVKLGLLLVLIYACHALAFAFAALLAAGLWALEHYKTPRTLITKGWPLLPALPLILLHLLLNQRGADRLVQSTSLFTLSPLERVWHTLSYQVSFFTPLNCFILFALITSALCSGSLRQISGRKLLPLILLGLLLLLLPTTVAGVDLVFDRFSLFLLPLLALAINLVPSVWRWQRVMQVLLILASSALLLGQAQSHAAFARRTAPLDSLLEQIPAEKRLLSLIDQPLGTGRAGQVLWHYALWYQAERRGLAEYNFAQASPQIVRYKVQPPLAAIKHNTRLEEFNWQSYGADRYDYIIIGHASPLGEGLFAGASCLPRLIRQASTWTLFEVIRSCP
jgi:hypothetical protein